MNYTLTVSSQGQVVIPIKARKALKIKPGSKITLRVDSTELLPKATITPDPISWVKQVRGLGKHIWGKGEVYIEQERKSWDDV